MPSRGFEAFRITVIKGNANGPIGPGHQAIATLNVCTTLAPWTSARAS